MEEFAELGNEGILALMSDSTNAERKGFTMSESSIGPVFDNLFDGCTKRIVVATFASNVHRVQQIVNSAVKYKRKIAICLWQKYDKYDKYSKRIRIYRLSRRLIY